MTEESYVSATPKCGKCGGELETTDDVRTDDSIVTCKDCGARIGTHGEVNAQMREEVMSAAKTIVDNELAKLRKSLKRLNK
jgi:hypothetical protein